jgi:histidinol-phosphate aminotransferase
MGRAIRPNTKILFIANPNNPTGTYNSSTELQKLLQDVAKANWSREMPVLVVVDEAYYEYAKVFALDYPDTLSMQKEFPNLMVLRTFSKAHALAGLRVGYGFADPDIIGALDRVRPPFNVSAVAQAGAEASLKDAARIQKAVKHVAAEKTKVLPGITSLHQTVLPSVGNFVLIDISPRRGQEMFDSLLRRGIIVRSMDEYGYPHHIRVTFGLAAENQQFLKAVKEVLGR